MRARQDGVGMVETIVAILIFSLVLIAQAAMQSVSLSNGKSANLKTVGVVLARDLADRMRANQVGAANGSYASAAAIDHGCSVVHFLHRHDTPATCTPEQIAGDDLKDWGDTVAASLPNGAGLVCIDSSPDDGDSAAAAACDGVGGNYAVKLWWTDKQAPAVGAGAPAEPAPAVYRFSLAFRP